MTLSKKISSMKKDEQLLIISPNIEAQMTGVWKASVGKDNLVRVDYIDGTSESSPASKELLDSPVDGLNVFSLTSFVQSCRPSNQ